MKINIKPNWYGIYSIDLAKHPDSDIRPCAPFDRIVPEPIQFWKIAEKGRSEYDCCIWHRTYVSGFVSYEKMHKVIEESYYHDTCQTLGMLTKYGHIPAISFDIENTWEYTMITSAITSLYIGFVCDVPQYERIAKVATPNQLKALDKIIERTVEILWNTFEKLSEANEWHKYSPGVWDNEEDAKQFNEYPFYILENGIEIDLSAIPFGTLELF